MPPHFPAHTALVREPAHSAGPKAPAGRGPFIRHAIASASRLAACSLALTCGVVLAQASPAHHHPPSTTPIAPAEAQPPSDVWSEANDTVGQFKRGHIDLLRWEQRNPPRSKPEGKAFASTEPLSLQQALHMALQNQPRWWGRAGMSTVEQSRLNTAYQERVLQVRRAWIEAVSAQQTAQYSHQILQAAEAGAELAERMARIGNWSRARLMQEELLLWDARARVRGAELQALQSALALWQLTGDPQPKATQRPNASDPQQAWPEWLQLPPLPDLPPPEDLALATLEQRALAAHQPWSLAQTEATRLMAGQHANSMAQARQAMAPNTPAANTAAHASPWSSQPQPPQLPSRAPWSHSAEAALQAQADADALQRRIRADVRLAHAALHSALTDATQSRQEVQRLNTALQQETMLRYNGMLSSTWELLASARQRIQSVDAAHQAQRQAWLAWADLQAVLSGLPYTGRPGAASSPSTTTPPAGH